VHRELAGSYWSPSIRREIVVAAIANSIVVGAFDRTTGDQVGFARIVTDRATFAWICDVVVVREHRGRGLTTAMLEILLADPRLATLRRWCLATKDAHALYEKFGFEPVPAERWMERRIRRAPGRARSNLADAFRTDIHAQVNAGPRRLRLSRPSRSASRAHAL
jgi:GNAT superfamily N-acetyltransferase